MAKRGDKLTPKQLKFCNAYLESGNATESAILAGYSDKNAGTNADKLLKNTNVMKYLNEINEKLQSEKIADIIEIKQFWTDIIRNKEEVTKERLKASELLAKTGGAFIDKVQVDSNVTINPYGNLSEDELRRIALEDDEND